MFRETFIPAWDDQNSLTHKSFNNYLLSSFEDVRSAGVLATSMPPQNREETTQQLDKENQITNNKRY